MTLDDVCRIIDELSVMEGAYPAYSRPIEKLKLDYHTELLKITKEYDLKINALYALIQAQKKVKI